MTYDGVGDGPPSKTSKREAARQKARLLRVEQKKKDRRNRFLLQGSIIVASLVVVGLVAVTIWSQIPSTRSGPVNMLSDGIKVGEGFAAVTTPGLQPGDDPVPSEKVEGSEAVDIRVFVDYQCPICADFEEANEDQISTWVESGAATLEVHPIAILDRQSLGAKYSTRAANAAACVANYSPDNFYAFNSLLFEHQPKEQTEGLTDKELVTLAERAEVTSPTLIEKCIVDQTFKTWVNAATARAIAGPIPNSNIERVKGTPTIIVDGEKYTGGFDDATAFATFVSTAASNAFEEKATPTPTPTPAS
ncbi:MAG: hypothetical protein JWP30_1475 [Homoserinimonas sp.]|jgi:protein-disulfide isomerase|nr:hypothetical protein [Homoserinimonas sp.]